MKSEFRGEHFRHFGRPFFQHDVTMIAKLQNQKRSFLIELPLITIYILMLHITLEHPEYI